MSFGADDVAYILSILGLLGIIFTVYKYFRDPQIRTEKLDAVMELRLSNMEIAIQKMITNHLPHMDAKINAIQSQLAEQDKSIVRLGTIIEERLPRK